MADNEQDAVAARAAPSEDESALPGVHPWLIIGGVIVLVTVLATVSSVLFNSTLRREPVTGTIGPKQVDDGVLVDGTVTTADLTKNVLTLRITLDPTGSFDPNGSNVPSKPITMYDTGADGTKKVTFEAGKPIGATDLVLSLKGGRRPDRPAARLAHPGQLPVGHVPRRREPAVRHAERSDVHRRIGHPRDARRHVGHRLARADAVSDAVVPANLMVSKTVPAFSVVEAKQNITPEGVQPGIPPPGVLSDFSGFFWADIVVALSLVTMLIVYLQRRTDRSPRRPGGDERRRGASRHPTNRGPDEE